MKRSYVKHLVMRGEEGQTLTLGYDNRGEPYRSGIRISLYNGEYYRADEGEASVFIEDHEAIQLRDKLLELYPLKQA